MIVPQDLHIHTVFSTGDSAVMPEQTVEFIAELKHAKSIGISDHFEYLHGDVYEKYVKKLRSFEFHVGTEVDGNEWVDMALQYDFDYYIYHCCDIDADYKGVERLLSSSKPVIIAHPLHMGTDLDKIPPECLIEINNRYIWRSNWKDGLKRYVGRFRFILSSDAHQPNWLNLNIATHVAYTLGIKETILFNYHTSV